MTTSQTKNKLKAPTTESDVLREVSEFLDARATFFWRNNNAPMFAYGRRFAMPKFTPKGLPDIMAIIHGKFFAFEIKRPGNLGEREPNGRLVREGKLSPEQQRWGLRCLENGGIYQVVRNLDDVREVLAKHEALDMLP